jgi:MoaA/NifB/PqqE/SkfB family radical SAM enzyme
MEEEKKTKKGIFIREHKGFGLIAFSPFSGLFFAIKEKYAKNVLEFCNGKTTEIPDEIVNHLEIGCNSITNQNFTIKHYLPQNEIFSESNELPEHPIVINWLISNKCNCNCSYCNAGDVIDKPFESSNISETALKILSLHPLAVVISGGEPLMEKAKMIEAIQILGNKTGIVVDTNGLIWNDDIVKQFKKYNIVVRVSLDSLHGETNSKIRPTRDKKTNKSSLSTIIKHIVDYRKNDIPVLIHSVMTSNNKSSLDDLYAKLPALGVNGWRIFSVIRPNDEGKKESFIEVMKYRNQGNFEEQQSEIKRKVKHFMNSHVSKPSFSIQIIQTSENDKNSVVLVLPDGKFVTEHKFSNHKTEIKVDAIFKSVDLGGHFERYLGKF